MLLYAVIMLLGAALLMAFGIAIYRGRTDLIHSYHQTKVRDKAAYGRAFGKALFCTGLAPLVSGIVGFFAGTVAAVAILIIGLAIGTGLMVAVQRKYNNGVF